MTICLPRTTADWPFTGKQSGRSGGGRRVHRGLPQSEPSSAIHVPIVLPKILARFIDAASSQDEIAGLSSAAPACPHNPTVPTLTGGAIPTLNSRPADDVETTSGETVPDSEFSE